ncbi:hypothetical protein SAMN04488564_102238 [Lentzea waywayandensis]|uniref:Uncharacterized protein n=1 Tax=Lentzea waywayandensis TaxID=84724 RepID=A0A1I6DC83_9PSEU|nr:hypothetical protein [Lentzea waywayandensis]SFR03054.1 hypothetical protein SAMN04488564_102238 [Lentzea waywayandensis]
MFALLGVAAEGYGGQAARTGDAGQIGRAFVDALAQVPAARVLTGIVLVEAGWTSRRSHTCRTCRPHHDGSDRVAPQGNGSKGS